ncbi:hypothetical protein STANM309S_04674 [Streptomyces tanashiensis]
MNGRSAGSAGAGSAGSAGTEPGAREAEGPDAEAPEPEVPESEAPEPEDQKAAGSVRTSARTSSGVVLGQHASRNAVTARARSILRAQAAPMGPERRSARSWRARTDPGADPGAAGRVGRRLLPYRRDDRGELRRREPPVVRAVRDGQVLRGGRVDPAVQRAVQHLRHPGVVLDPGRRLAVLGPDRVTGDLLVEGGLPDPGLAERGQHFGDVREEGPVGAEDEEAGAADPLRMRVEQVRGPVQAHRGLAGAGRALHAQGGGGLGAYEVVLFGLDGGGDVPHGADPGALDLPGDEGAHRPRRAVREALVLQGGQVLGRAPAVGGPAEAAAPEDALRVVRAGLVVGAGDGRAPVDDERRGGRVLGDAAAADVVDLAVLAVEASEEQRPGRLFAHLLGAAAQVVSECFGVGAGGGDVLTGDDLLGHVLGHTGQGGAAGVVVGAFAGELKVQ